MSEPVTAAWAQYARFWTPLVISAGLWALAVLGLLGAIVFKLYRG